MIKIIKAGSPKHKQVINTTCKECRTEFEFDRGEATSYMDRNEQYFKIQCPLPGCGASVHLVDVGISSFGK